MMYYPWFGIDRHYDGDKSKQRKKHLETCAKNRIKRKKKHKLKK